MCLRVTVTRHSSHVTRHTSHSHVTRHSSLVTRHTSHCADAGRISRGRCGTCGPQPNVSDLCQWGGWAGLRHRTLGVLARQNYSRRRCSQREKRKAACCFDGGVLDDAAHGADDAAADDCDAACAADSDADAAAGAATADPTNHGLRTENCDV